MIDEIFIDETIDENLIELNQKEEKQSEIENKDAQDNLEKEKIKFGDILFNRKFKVFAKINEDGYVTDIASEIVLKDTTGWTLIDEGEGDRFVCAGVSYFDEPITDENGNYRYKIR